jgi:RHS repeat-associated protein
MMKQNMTYRSGDYLQKTYTPLIDKYIADYDAAGRLPGFANFNSTQTTYGYDNANRLTAINNQMSDNSVISSYAFTFDSNGNRTNIAQNEPYAPSIGEGNSTYTYNTQKNRLLSTSAEGSFGYDDEGQIQTGYSASYTFDYEYRLKTIDSTQFNYDGGGKRLEAIRGGMTTRYIYGAGGALLAEADGNNNITQYYIYGNGLLATVTSTNNVYCYHYNGIGSTVAMTDQTQAVVNKYSYDVFGNIASQQEAIAQPFKYVGQFGVMTEPNGFYYMRARYYDPKVGRFISEDPIGFDGGDVNLLAYVGNNPVTGIDPSGLYDPNNPMSDMGLSSIGIGDTFDYNSFAMGGVSTPSFPSNSTPNPYLENSVFGSNCSSTISSPQNTYDYEKIFAGGAMMTAAGLGFVAGAAVPVIESIVAVEFPVYLLVLVKLETFYVSGFIWAGSGYLFYNGWNTLNEGLNRHNQSHGAGRSF